MPAHAKGIIGNDGTIRIAWKMSVLDFPTFMYEKPSASCFLDASLIRLKTFRRNPQVAAFLQKIPEAATEIKQHAINFRGLNLLEDAAVEFIFCPLQYILVAQIIVICEGPMLPDLLRRWQWKTKPPTTTAALPPVKSYCRPPRVIIILAEAGLLNGCRRRAQSTILGMLIVVHKLLVALKNVVFAILLVSGQT